MYVASELQRYKDTVRCGALGAKVPVHRKEQLTQTLIVRLLKTHLVLLLRKLAPLHEKVSMAKPDGGLGLPQLGSCCSDLRRRPSTWLAAVEAVVVGKL